MQQYVDKLKKIIADKIPVLDSLVELDRLLMDKLSGDADEILDNYAEKKDEILEKLSKLEDDTSEAIGNIQSGMATGKKVSSADRNDLLVNIGKLNTLAAQALNDEKNAKTKVTSYIQSRRGEVKKGRASSRAALNYYQVQNNTVYIDPQFMDRKK